MNFYDFSTEKLQFWFVFAKHLSLLGKDARYLSSDIDVWTFITCGGICLCAIWGEIDEVPGLPGFCQFHWSRFYYQATILIRIICERRRVPLQVIHSPIFYFVKKRLYHFIYYFAEKVFITSTLKWIFLLYFLTILAHLFISHAVVFFSRGYFCDRISFNLFSLSQLSFFIIFSAQ